MKALTAYVLHRWDWSESSLILDVWTREQGRLAVAAKGAKRPSRTDRRANSRPVHGKRPPPAANQSRRKSAVLRHPLGPFASSRLRVNQIGLGAPTAAGGQD